MTVVSMMLLGYTLGSVDVSMYPVVTHIASRVIVDCTRFITVAATNCRNIKKYSFLKYTTSLPNGSNSSYTLNSKLCDSVGLMLRGSARG